MDKAMVLAMDQEMEEVLLRRRPARMGSGACPRSVVMLECESSSAEGGVCNVYLVGTSHASQESCQEVQSIIRYLKPQVVFLELCTGCPDILDTRTLEMSEKFQVIPGSEFRVAFEEARSYGAKVMFGDRPIDITLRRTWSKMPLWERTKFMCYMSFQSIFFPSPEKLRKMLTETDDVDRWILKAFPTLKDTLVEERNMYMSSKLINVAREHSSVVAVVDEARLSGIKRHWQQPIEAAHLLQVPARMANLPRRILFALTGVAVASIVYFLANKRMRRHRLQSFFASNFVGDGGGFICS